MWKEVSFWFQQPGLSLNDYDLWFAYFFAAIFLLGILLKIGTKFTSYPLTKKILNKFATPSLWLGFVGLFWFGLRYENTAYLSNRMWAGIVILTLVIWLVYILKYLIFQFGPEKKELDRQLENSRYIPSSRK